MDFLTHAVTIIYLIVDSALVAIPIRILHIYQSMILGVIYVIFSIIYDVSGGSNMLGKPYIYSPIDYSEKPGIAAAYVLVILFIGIPIVHLIFYGLYSLRIYLFRKFYPKQYEIFISNCDSPSNTSTDQLNMNQYPSKNWSSSSPLFALPLLTLIINSKQEKND